MNDIEIIDFHSHIIPTVDHGSTSLDVSVEQVEFALKYGVNTIIATPHFYPHTHNIDLFLEERNKMFNLLKKELNDKGIGINIRCGAEVLLYTGLEKTEKLNELCVEGTRTLLIELPFSEFLNEYILTLDEIISLGYKVVLAHAERYPIEIIEQIIPLGVVLQLNADCVSNLFICPHIMSWIKNGLVVGIGSDIHMLDKSAYVKYGKAKKRLRKYFYGIMKKSKQLI